MRGALAVAALCSLAATPVLAEQLGSTDHRALISGFAEFETRGVWLIACRNPNVDGGKMWNASGSIVARADIVVTAAHAFQPEHGSRLPDGSFKRTVAGKFDFIND